MTNKRFFIWLPAVLWLAALYGWQRWGLPVFSFSVTSMQWSQGVGFAVFSALLMGAVARGWPAAPLPLLRLTAVLGGSAAAALEIGLLGLPGVFFFPLWAAALIGVSVVSVAARLLPLRLLRVWLNREKSE